MENPNLLVKAKGKENRIPGFFNIGLGLGSNYTIHRCSPIKRLTPRKSVKKSCLFCQSSKELRLVHSRSGKSKDTPDLIKRYFDLNIEEGHVCRGCERKIQHVAKTIESMAAGVTDHSFKRGASSPLAKDIYLCDNNDVVWFVGV